MVKPYEQFCSAHINAINWKLMNNNNNMMSLYKDQSMFKRKSHDQLISQELPYHDYPTLDQPSEFYKILHRISENQMAIFLGLKFQQFPRFQEDYIVSLINIFMKECPTIKLIVIRPNLLYGQVDIELGMELNFNVEIKILQERLFLLLKYAKIAFEGFVRQNLNPHCLLDKKFNQEELIQKFQQSVIKFVKGKQSEIFGNDKL